MLTNKAFAYDKWISPFTKVLVTSATKDYTSR